MVLQKYQRFTYQRHIFKITSVTLPSPAPCNGGNSSLLTPGSNSGATLHRRDRDSVVCLIQLKSSWGYEDLNLSQGKNLGKMLSLPLETGRRMGEGCLVHLSTAPQKCQKSAAPSGSQESDRGT